MGFVNKDIREHGVQLCLACTFADKAISGVLDCEGRTGFFLPMALVFGLGLAQHLLAML